MLLMLLTLMLPMLLRFELLCTGMVQTKAGGTQAGQHQAGSRGWAVHEGVGGRHLGEFPT